MVCAKCQKKSSGTTSLATPEVKKKNDMYFGSPAGSSSSKAGTKTSATLGNNGIGKVRLIDCRTLCLTINIVSQSKLLSKAARNPYATYSTTCTGKECSTKVDQGRKYCLKCSYKANGIWLCAQSGLCYEDSNRKTACAMCGKSNSKTSSTAPVVAGQKFNLK